MDINSLQVLGTTTTRSNQERDIVGFIDCRCGAVSTVLRGKAQLYEHCPSCGVKMANGKKNTQYLLDNLRTTKDAPAAPTSQNTNTNEETVIVRRSILDKLLGIELFTL